jgi:predicted ester cyclase
VNGLWAAFPDLSFEVASAGEAGPGLVAAQWIMRGTNLGSMMGLPPTGSPSLWRVPILSEWRTERLRRSTDISIHALCRINSACK